MLVVMNGMNYGTHRWIVEMSFQNWNEQALVISTSVSIKLPSESLHLKLHWLCPPALKAIICFTSQVICICILHGFFHTFPVASLPIIVSFKEHERKNKTLSSYSLYTRKPLVVMQMRANKIKLCSLVFFFVSFHCVSFSFQVLVFPLENLYLERKRFFFLRMLISRNLYEFAKMIIFFLFSSFEIALNATCW